MTEFPVASGNAMEFSLARNYNNDDNNYKN
jgi:hypothetical protein